MFAFAAPWNEPCTLEDAASPTAPCRSGKFCFPLGPVSESPASFSVTPVGERSIPRPVLLSIELPWIRFPVPAMTATPAAPLTSMVLPCPEADAPRPPVVPLRSRMLVVWGDGCALMGVASRRGAAPDFW